MASGLCRPVHRLIVASFFLQKTKTSDGLLGEAFAAVLVIHLLTMGLSLALLGAYVFDIFRNPRVKGDLRVLWVIVVIFANALAMPVYWALYLRPALPSPATKQRTPLRATRTPRPASCAQCKRLHPVHAGA